MRLLLQSKYFIKDIEEEYEEQGKREGIGLKYFSVNSSEKGEMNAQVRLIQRD